jgi:hypothetical protein
VEEDRALGNDRTVLVITAFTFLFELLGVTQVRHGR